MGIFLIILSLIILFFLAYILLRLLFLNSKSKKVLRLSKSLGKSFLEVFSVNEDIKKLRKKYPRLLSFLKKRFDLKTFFGLPLTILSLTLFYILSLSSGLIIDFLQNGVNVALDVHLDNLLFFFRNEFGVKLFLWITMLAKLEVVIFFAVALAITLLVLKKKWSFYALWLAIVGNQIFVYFFKFILNRPRPIHPVYLELSNSLPSGHAAIATTLYGFIGYLFFRVARKSKTKFWTIVGALFVILLISFSRLYLGVHYLSDVLFGQLIGLLWLIIGISLVEWKKLDFTNKFVWNRDSKIVIVILSILSLGFYIFWCVFSIPQLDYKSVHLTEKTTIENINFFEGDQFVKYTETLSGNTQEPISLIISAKDDTDLIRIFNQAGWVYADSLNSQSVIKMITEAIINQNYSTAPMTPSFWNKQVHDFGFEKATESNTIRQRHHARFWSTDLQTADGKNIYVGTASLDTGIKWFVTHKISPDIDTERDLLLSDLSKNNEVKNLAEFQLIPPTLGKNFTGDQFFTDGKVYFVEF